VPMLLTPSLSVIGTMDLFMHSMVGVVVPMISVCTRTVS
jgi:hypothetical protein